MKKLILVLLFSPIICLGQTYNSYGRSSQKVTVKKETTNNFGETTYEIETEDVTKPYDGAYTNPGRNRQVKDRTAEIYTQAAKENAAAMTNMIKNMRESGAFETARQKAKDITSLNGKNLNKYKYIVVSNVSASKEKEIPKIREKINDELSKTNFKIIQNLNNIPEDLIMNPDLGLYLHLLSENENWPFKNVILSLTDIQGEMIHQRAVRHDRTASFLTGLVLKNIKIHPHKFDINALKEEEKIIKKSVNVANKEDVIKELKNLKELLDMEIITKEEFDNKAAELKKIILDN